MSSYIAGVSQEVSGTIMKIAVLYSSSLALQPESTHNALLGWSLGERGVEAGRSRVMQSMEN